MTIVYFKVDLKECQRRVSSRTNHQTINNKNMHKASRIVYSFHKKLVVPTKEEGFKQVITVETMDEINSLLRRLGISERLEVEESDNNENESKENDNWNTNNSTDNLTLTHFNASPTFF